MKGIGAAETDEARLHCNKERAGCQETNTQQNISFFSTSASIFFVWLISL